MESRFILLIGSLGIALLLSACNTRASRQSSEVTEKDSVGQSISGDVSAQDVPMALLDKLGRLYGDNPPAVAGFSVDSKNCPDFIDGVYINGKDSLVIQTKGDSATVRKQLEEVLESKDFIVEPSKTYTQKELYAIQEELRKRWMALMETPVLQNVIGAGTRGDYVEIFLIVNTPEKRREFRREVMDSPAFHFNGTETPAENATVGVNDTLGVALRPEYTVYSTESDTAAFILYNHSGTTINCGEVYFITYEDSAGVWRELPINATFNSLGHWVEDGDSLRYTAYLYPAVHPNRPGRYRFFYDVTVGDGREGLELHMMAEFRLSDDAAELQRARPTPIPDIILDGLSLEEYYERKERLLKTKIFTITDEMPEFPEGGIEGLYAYMSERVPKDDTKTMGIYRFVVERDGSLSHFEVMESSGNKQFDDAALRIIQEMPKWKPGKRRGKAVRTRYSVSVNFF